MESDDSETEFGLKRSERCKSIVKDYTSHLEIYASKAWDRVEEIVKSAKVKRHDDESLDDIAEMQKEKRGYEEKDRRRNMNQIRKNHQLLEHSLNDCVRCLTSAKIAKHAVVAVGIHTYLAVVEWDGLDEQHCLIVPTEHACSSIQLDENVWDEMRIWRKGLVAMWREIGDDCLFLEMSRNVAHGAHLVIECVPVPVEIGETAPIYFKKAIMECEEVYADNKKLIEIKDLRRQIPRNFSYFAVDFGLKNGYAHVIENVQSFPSSFAHEIIAGMLDLPPNKWRKKTMQSYSELKAKCDAMKASWEPYDWTKRIDRTSR
ncbi:hypothetical protein KIN20_006250 [Parelaphostrongylus tenuis]|uniref:CWF19-like protein 2 n=1 Tax=Parelaphostrongylus tenuis TaxID=148309 RepID=A0AAD5QGJ6_PARTN|nr:hypothetical protein KIN20_006250 [Parelaphostrongylus tenuis]